MFRNETTVIKDIRKAGCDFLGLYPHHTRMQTDHFGAGLRRLALPRVTLGF